MKKVILISILFINSTSGMYSSMTNDSGSIGSASNNDFVDSVVDLLTTTTNDTSSDK